MNVAALIEKEGWLADDLARAALELGVGLTLVRWSDLAARLSDTEETVTAGDAALHAADAVFLRTMRVPTFEQVFFRMDALHRLAALGTTVVNAPGAVEVCVDKYRALAMVRAAGVATPATAVCQRYADAMQAFDALGGDVVLKPMFGSQGFGVVRLTDRVMAQRALAQLERMGQVAYLQACLAGAAEEMRLFVLGPRILAAVRKASDRWPRNVALGTQVTATDVDDAVAAAALGAARACGAEIAGVDVVIDPASGPTVLEVNAMPGWRALAQVCGIDVTRCVLEHLGGRTSEIGLGR